MTEPEDRRTAINIKMGLASNLITVALAFIGAEGAIAVFVLDKRQSLFYFYGAGILAFTTLTSSVIFGGLGISKIYRGGFHGKWELSDKGKFNSQALLCLLGAALVLVSAVLGKPKSGVEAPVQNASSSAEIKALETEMSDLRQNQELLKQNLASLMAARSSRSSTSNGRHDAK